MARLKLAIMGGTFNPIHVGHLVCAEEAVGQFGLDKVLFMPTGKSPHKETEFAAGPEDRYQMVVLATAGNPRFEVSRHELDSEQISYTVDTLRHFRAEQPDSELYFITGTDAVIEILEWKEPAEIFRLATLIAAARFGYPVEKIPAKEQKFLEENGARFMDIPCIGVSSSLVRQRVASGQSIRYLVPEGVGEFIGKERLYLQK